MGYSKGNYCFHIARQCRVLEQIKEHLYFTGNVMPEDIHRMKIAHLCWVYGMNASSKTTELDYPFSVKSIFKDQVSTWLLFREECSPPQRYLRGPSWTPSHLLRVTTGPCNPNLQVVIRHVSHVCSQHLFVWNAQKAI